MRTCWSLDDALNWRCSNFEPHVSMNQAFDELRELCTSSRAQAWGQRARDPLSVPLSAPPRPPHGKLIPSEGWEDYSRAPDRVGVLNFTSIRLPAWVRVEFDTYALAFAWHAFIEARKELSARATLQSPSEAASTRHLSGSPSDVAGLIDTLPVDLATASARSPSSVDERRDRDLDDGRRRRGSYGAALEGWLASQELRRLHRMSLRAIAGEFQSHCKEQCPGILLLLPKRLRHMEPLIERIIERRVAAAPVTAVSRGAV
jgi:hypothetical protein